jgi:hypothetical protein
MLCFNLGTNEPQLDLAETGRHRDRSPACVVECNPGPPSLSVPIFLFGMALLLLSSERVAGQASGLAEIELTDAQTGSPMSCRVQLRTVGGKALKPLSSQTVQQWSLVSGLLRYRGRPGDYLYEISCGPEYSKIRGGFGLDKNSETLDSLELQRHTNMAIEGWYAGDLLSCLPAEQTQPWMAAEGLLIASSITPSVNSQASPTEEGDGTLGEDDVDESIGAGSALDPKDSAGVAYRAYWDDRPNSGLLFHHWEPPSKVPLDLPSSRLIGLSKQSQASENQPAVHIEIQKLWERDLPVWLASGRIDSIQLLSDHLTIDGSPGSKVRPLVKPEGNFDGKLGPGRLVEQIYWLTLEAGLRIPPSAGSGFGKRSSPLGYNRVYALLGRPDAQQWWRAIREGNCFVTNGPLLRASVNGMPPGHLFASGQPLELDVNLALSSSDPVEYLELIFNGSSLYRAALDEHAKRGGRIPVLTISESGWIVIRVVTKNQDSYRLATTAPFSFEIAGRKRISRSAVGYFQRWLDEASRQIQSLPPDETAAHQPYLKAAERFWNSQLQQATAD